MKRFAILLAALLMTSSSWAQVADRAPKPDPDKGPVASYWLHTDMQPLNYAQVLESIRYHPWAIDASLEGTVLLEIVVDDQGRYVSHQVLNEVSPLLAKTVNEQAPNLIFPKPKYQGEAVTTTVVVPFRFRLDDGW